MTQTQTIPTTHSYADAFARVTRRAEAKGTEALNDLRSRAFDDFVALGIPSTRHEDWRYTNLKRLDAALPMSEPNDEVSAADVQRFMIPDLDAHLIVFVDGHHR